MPAKPRKGNAQPLPPEVHRRVLEAINRGRSPRELTKNPALKLDQKTAAAVFETRARAHPLGFTHVDQLFAVGILDRPWLDDIFPFFGPAAYGEWGETIDFENPEGGGFFSTIHAAVLKNERVILIGNAAGSGATILWDPDNPTAPGVWPDVQPADNLACSGHSFLSDGQLLVAGGGGLGTGNEPLTGWRFDPGASPNGTWVPTAGTRIVARWYPTLVTLGGGRVFIVGGNTADLRSALYLESSDSFVEVTDPPGSPGASTRNFPQLYPGLHLLPGGEVFYTRTGFGSAGPLGTGAADPDPSSGYFRFTGATSGEWIAADEPEFGMRNKGMSVQLLEQGGPHGWLSTLMVIGGSDPDAATSAETIETATLTPVWDHDPFTFPDERRNVNAVVLPDGKVFVCGGRTVAPSPCWLYDPEAPLASRWSQAADLPTVRHYHSVAVLLHTGQVMVSGWNASTIDVYDPPYMFNGARPQITGAPGTVHHGQTMTVTSPEAADIDRVVLVRPMAVTHQTDSEQRLIPLDFTRSGYALTVTAPNGNHPHPVAPRGWYMLFVLNGSRLPSEGHFILLH